MSHGEQFLGPDGPEPRFPIAFRGYDRVQVDAWLEARGRQVAEAQSRVSEMARRAQALESRQSGPEPDAPQPPPTETLVTHVLDRAHDIARQLPERVTRDAEAERKALQQSATEAVETARARSAQIVEAARCERDAAAATLEEARKRADVARHQASDGAKERVRRRWDHATSALTEAELELAGLRARQKGVLAELNQLEHSVAESRQRLRQNGTADAEADTEADTVVEDHRPEPGPEQQHWSMMPIEW